MRPADRNSTALWRVGSRTRDPQRLTNGAGRLFARLVARRLLGRLPPRPVTGLRRSGSSRPKEASRGRSPNCRSVPARPSGAPTARRSPSPRPSICWPTPGESEDDRAPRAHAPLVAERLDYQADGAGIRRGVRMQLHVLDLESGSAARSPTATGTAALRPGRPTGQLAFAAASAPTRPRSASRRFTSSTRPTAMTEPRVVAFADGVAAPSRTPDGAALSSSAGPGRPARRRTRISCASRSTAATRSTSRHRSTAT